MKNRCAVELSIVTSHAAIVLSSLNIAQRFFILHSFAQSVILYDYLTIFSPPPMNFILICNELTFCLMYNMNLSQHDKET